MLFSLCIAFPLKGKMSCKGEKFITVIFRAKQVYRATVSIHVGAATRRLFAMSSAVILL
jgi:hypothetical protein